MENNEKIFGKPASAELLKMFCTLKDMDLMYQEVIILRGIVLFSRGKFFTLIVFVGFFLGQEQINAFCIFGTPLLYEYNACWSSSGIY